MRPLTLLTLSFLAYWALETPAEKVRQSNQDGYLQQIVRELEEKKYHSQLERCQKRVKKENTKIGRFEIMLTLSKGGKVQSIALTKNSARNHVFLVCAQNKARKWKFSAAPATAFKDNETPTITLGLPH